MAKTQTLGIGRLLISVYGIFALSATARASYQLFRKFDDAPVAYTLSLLSAITYILVTISLTKQSQRWARVSTSLVIFELVGVVTVGVLSLALPELFKHPSVWSEFGIGYGFLPLALPILALIWLGRRSK
jgi:cytochrome bd-type quinol oxidase subunit 2